MKILEGKSRLLVTATRIKCMTYERFLIHVLSMIARDSRFPHKPWDALNIEVDS